MEHWLIGKRVRCDSGFYGQDKPWFGTVVDVIFDEHRYRESRDYVRVIFDGRDAASTVPLSDLGTDLFVIEDTNYDNLTEIEE